MSGTMRNIMPEQPAEIRKTNFEEIAKGYTEEMAVAEAQRCLNCPNPMCMTGCPVKNRIPQFIHAITERDFKEAFRILKVRNSLPAICGRVCPQEKQCEAKCVLGLKGEPVAIGNLERFVADYAREHGFDSSPAVVHNLTGKRVAVVGSGPSGLTIAGELAKYGHTVTIFEALHKAGGVLAYGIPEFRLPKEIVENEINALKEMGVTIITNAIIGRTFTVDELLGEEGFDAVYLAIGASVPYFMNIPGEGLNGVYSANEFLTRVNLMHAYKFPKTATPIYIGKNVAVVGGGNVAFDAACTAKRLGAEHVYIVYRRGKDEMPARKEEIRYAEEEGIEFKFLNNPVRVLGSQDGKVVGLECIQMELGEPDASGRRRPIEKKGSEFTIPVDTVIMAIGQGVNPLIKQTTPKLAVTEQGTIIVDENCKTNVEGVFAGGDVVTGPTTVISAVGAGRRAAYFINEYLKTRRRRNQFHLPVGISARHCHVTPKVLEQLYGQGFRLSVKKYIKQPQQFASNQRVKFVSDSGVEMNLSIVGPCRAYTQIEISATDARTLGIPAIVRESGNTKGSPGGKLVGPAGEVKLDEGAIVVARHIHISEETANKYQLKQGDRVKIRVEGPRSATLDNVLVRAGLEDFDEVHLDTDESNALFVKSDDIVTIIIDDD